MSRTRLRRLVDDRSREYSGRVFLEDARSSRQVTFGQLDSAVATWVSRLDSDGVVSGAPVLIDIADPIDFAVVFLAVIAAGRCAVPVDPNAPSGEKQRLRTSIAPDIVISDDASLPATFGPDSVDCTAHSPATAADHPPGSVRLHTSGSTGEPKAVQLSEANLLHVAGQIADHNALVPGERGYNSLPLFHINAEVVGLLATLMGGSALILDRKFGRRGFWDLIESREITWINAVPAMLAILSRDSLPRRPERLRFIRSASAPLSPATRNAFVQAYGPILVESYGMTEAASQITATALPPVGSPSGTVGRAIGTELQIRSENGQIVQDGAIGRIWIRGNGVITGYVGGRAPERFDANGWLDTGDLGQCDAQGNLTHVGRADDVINRGGELVHPREIEEVLQADERVIDAVVLGRPDDVLGEVPVAYVVTPVESDQLRADLGELCERQLSRFKRPAEFVFVAELPRAATGKILRRDLADVSVARG